jgi:hypothetical protein
MESKPHKEIRWRKTDKTRTTGRPVFEEIVVTIDPKTKNLNDIPTQDEPPPQKPPEVIREERKKAQIEDWQRRTDI